MGWLGKVTGISFGKKGSAPGKAVLVKTESAGSQERENELYHPPGISSAPTKNDRVVEIPIGTGTRVAIVCHNYRIEVEPEAGETIIYSTDAEGSSVKSQIKLDNDGQIIMNDGTDYAVAYEDLKSAFDQIKSDLNDFITAYNAHVHITTCLVTGAPATAVATLSQAMSSAADMSGAKIEKVRIP